MSDLTQIYERLARLEAKADHRDAQLEKMDEKLDAISAAIEQARGAKYVLAGGAALMGGIGGFLVKLIPFMNGMPK